MSTWLRSMHCCRHSCRSLHRFKAEAHICWGCRCRPPRRWPGSRRWPLRRLRLLMLLCCLRLPTRLGALDRSVCLCSDVRDSLPIVVAALRLVGWWLVVPIL